MATKTRRRKAVRRVPVPYPDLWLSWSPERRLMVFLQQQQRKGPWSDEQKETAAQQMANANKFAVQLAENEELKADTLAAGKETLATLAARRAAFIDQLKQLQLDVGEVTVKLVMAGSTQAELARQLGRTPMTVSFQVGTVDTDFTDDDLDDLKDWLDESGRAGSGDPWWDAKFESEMDKVRKKG